MTDYTEVIKRNFARFHGIVEDAQVVSDLMNRLDAVGMAQLVTKIRTNEDTSGLDFLLEAWVARELLIHEEIARQHPNPFEGMTRFVGEPEWEAEEGNEFAPIEEPE